MLLKLEQQSHLMRRVVLLQQWICWSGNATGLTGTPDITVRNVTGVAATFTGVLTYDDVTNVDSLGIVTARSGFEIGASGVGGTITSAGAAEFAGIVTALV